MISRFLLIVPVLAAAGCGGQAPAPPPDNAPSAAKSAGDNVTERPAPLDPNTWDGCVQRLRASGLEVMLVVDSTGIRDAP